MRTENEWNFNESTKSVEWDFYELKQDMKIMEQSKETPILELFGAWN